MEVSGQLHAPADSTPARNNVTHRLAGWMGSRADLDGFLKKEKMKNVSFTARRLKAPVSPITK